MEPFNSCVFPARVAQRRKHPATQPDDFAIDHEPELPLPSDARERVAQALDLLIDVELKLLAANDARQANANARITALATAAIALPPLTLSLSTTSSNTGVFKAAYGCVVVVAVIIVGLSVWNGWRWRRRSDERAESTTTADVQRQAVISIEAPSTWTARREWRDYQHQTAAGDADPIRTRQLALRMWRARVDDSHAVAQTKDKMSVAVAVVFAIALGISVVIVFQAGFTS